MALYLRYAVKVYCTLFFRPYDTLLLVLEHSQKVQLALLCSYLLASLVQQREVHLFTLHMVTTERHLNLSNTVISMKHGCQSAPSEQKDERI